MDGVMQGLTAASLGTVDWQRIAALTGVVILCLAAGLSYALGRSIRSADNEPESWRSTR